MLDLHSAFTSSYKCISLTLKNTTQIIYDGRSYECEAQWDTGASGTCISDAIASKLGLVAMGKKTIATPAGKTTVNTYLISILLPNDVLISDIEVCDSHIGEQGIDMLVGMDIISRGDFAVSNHNGQTFFSFRLPSVKRTDYVLEANIGKIVGPKHGKGSWRHK